MTLLSLLLRPAIGSRAYGTRESRPRVSREVMDGRAASGWSSFLKCEAKPPPLCCRAPPRAGTRAARRLLARLTRRAIARDSAIERVPCDAAARRPAAFRRDYEEV